MKTLIKILAVTFIIIFSYDSANFFFQKYSTNKEKTELDLRKNLQPRLFEELPPPQDYEDDCIPAMLCVLLIGSVAVITIYRNCLMRYEEKLEMGENSEITESLTYITPLKQDLIEALTDNEREIMTESFRYSKQEKTASVVIIGKNETSGLVQFLPKPPPVGENVILLNENELINEEGDALKCPCTVEKFDERLEAVEGNLKSTEDLTKEWGKRIERAEMELISLHHEMYGLLCNARFKPPSSEMDCSSQLQSSQYIPNIIAETKKHLEENELFIKSFQARPFSDEIKTVPAVNKTQEKIEEKMTETVSSPCLEECRVQELANKNEELRRKTESLVNDLEEVVRRESKLKVIPRVPTHIVTPYKRTMYTETRSLKNDQNKLKASKYKYK